MMKKFFLASALFSSISFSVYAAPEMGNSWHFGSGMGVTFPHLTDSHLSSGIGWPEDDYTVTDVEAQTLFSVFGGYTWNNNRNWLPFYHLRANYTYGVRSDITGHVIQYGYAQFDNYQYQYRVQTQTLLAIAKVDLFSFHRIMPFISAGIGEAWHDVSDYQEHAFPGITPRESPAFGGRNTSSFAYTFGAGLDYILCPHIWLALEYQYGELGKIKTANSFFYTDEHLHPKLTANNLLFTITIL